jgi:hypothetical protein
MTKFWSGLEHYILAKFLGGQHKKLQRGSWYHSAFAVGPLPN